MSRALQAETPHNVHALRTPPTLLSTLGDTLAVRAQKPAPLWPNGAASPPPRARPPGLSGELCAPAPMLHHHTSGASSTMVSARPDLSVATCLQQMTTSATTSKSLKASRSAERLPLPMGHLHELVNSIPFAGNQMSDHTTAADLRHPAMDTIAQSTLEPSASIAQNNAASIPFAGNQMSDHTTVADTCHPGFNTIGHSTLQLAASVTQEDVATTALVACSAQIVQDKVDTTVALQGCRESLLVTADPTLLLESMSVDVNKLDEIVHLWEGNRLGIDGERGATETLNLLNGLLEGIERLADWRWPQTAQLRRRTDAHNFQDS